jgi:hypothetical protein
VFIDQNRDDVVEGRRLGVEPICEMLDALDSPLAPRTLDGLRRRTRAMLGRCQGFYCQAAVTALFAERTGVPPSTLLGLDHLQARSTPGGPRGAPSGAFDLASVP